VLDPGEVIIGGSFGHATQQWLLPAARAEMHNRWPFRADRPLPALQLDTIGPYAAATGAALLAASTFEAAEAGA
jgi:predicted NBD/HSP70 family sugar kinase